MLEFIFLQANKSANQSLMPQFILIGGLLLIFYFFMILPQQRKQKQQQQFREGIKANDSVVTIGGMHGKVVGIEGETIILQVDKNTRIVFEKTAISQEATQKLKQSSAGS